MGRGALRGAFTAWLALIALQAVATTGGSGRIVGIFTDLDSILQRVLNPKIAAIPDRSGGAPQQPVFGFADDGSVGLGPAFGNPITETPSGGNPIGLPPIPGRLPTPNR